MVDHNILFRKLLKRDLPSPIMYLLYTASIMRVRWDHQFSEFFYIKWCTPGQCFISVFVCRVFGWVIGGVVSFWCWLPLALDVCGLFLLRS